MIIDSSAVKMQSEHKFASARRSQSAMSIWGSGKASTGSFVRTAVSTAQTAVRKDSDSEQKMRNWGNQKTMLWHVSPRAAAYAQ